MSNGNGVISGKKGAKVRIKNLPEQMTINYDGGNYFFLY